MPLPHSRRPRVKLPAARDSEPAATAAGVAGPPPRSQVGLEQLAELERMLDKELAKGLQREQELAASREREARVGERAALAEAAVREAKLEAGRQLRDAQLQADAAQQQLKACHGVVTNWGDP